MHKRMRPRKANAAGRDHHRTGSRDAVIILKRSFWLSPQVSALSVTARALLVELTAIYNGPESNGRLFLSVRDATHRLGLSDSKAANAAIHELLESGFMTETQAGHFAMKAGGRSRARAFRLNWKDDCGGPTSAEGLPELDFARLSDKQKKRVEVRSKAIARHRRQKTTVEESTTLSLIRADLARMSGGDSTTSDSGNGGNEPNPIREESTTHIYYHGGAGAPCGVPSRKCMVSNRRLSLRTAMANRRRPGQKCRRKLIARSRFPGSGW